MRNTDAQTQQIIKPNTLFCAHDRPTTLLNRTQSVPVNQSRSAKGSVRVGLCNCCATSLALLYVTASVGACILVSGGQLPLGYGTLCVKIKPASFTNSHAPVITARSPRPSLSVFDHEMHSLLPPQADCSRTTGRKYCFDSCLSLRLSVSLIAG